MRRNDLRLAGEVMRRSDELARDTDEPGKITRLFLTPSHKAAMARVRAWMEEAGLEVQYDDIGNVVGRLVGPAPDAPTFILGSHIDSVRDAGRYDGCFGVLSAIEAVAELNRTGQKLPVALEVVAFGEEEGVRFPITLSGSRALAGTFDSASLTARDADGISLDEALRQFGCDPARVPAIARERARICGYLETHIEQGPVLEEKGLALGVVTAFAGASRLRVKVTGEAGHAGTVPMGRRKDALAGVAAMVLAVEDEARKAAEVVATVGMIEALPGAVNVIPGEASFSIDLHSPNDDTRHRTVAAVEERMRAIAAERGLEVAIAARYGESAPPCDPALAEALGESCKRKGHEVFKLPSGAGHDAMAMADLCPIAMLFLRCKGGISHNPAEAITLEDAQAAIEVMLDFLLHYRPPAEDAKRGRPSAA
jgi:allantoate deiminase